MYSVLMLIPVCVFSIFTECYAQDIEWNLEKDSDGIKVYVRPNEGSDFDEFMATLTIADCALDEALDVLLDINNYESWFPECANPRIIEQIDEYHDIHYIETLATWPADNRFGVYEQTTTLSNNGTKAEIVFIANAAYPIEAEDMVRINEAKGKWTLESQETALTITYQFKGNPGGSIPAWLANTFVVQHPFETLSNFKELMEN